MKYICTRDNNEKASFEEAVINGLSPAGGLYFPEKLPPLHSSFFENIEQKNNNEIAYHVLKPFVENSVADDDLRAIINDTLSFPTPTIFVEDKVFSLELYYGPTQAFKDVGARFMSRILSFFYKNKNEKLTVFVATSGDTGSAVANGFYNIEGIDVKILLPKGKVSPFQEYQMTSLGNNIHAIEVDGTFDDCQKLVKEAFNDQLLRKSVALSSANSINIARLLPQMIYYFFAYKQLKSIILDKKWVVSVPSGNLGNLTAGLMAKSIGLPINKLIAAHNANDTFHNYLDTGNFEKKESVLTVSNAMDVGNPSNFERISHMYRHSISDLKKDVRSSTITDKATIEEIKRCHDEDGYVLDPHGAVGKLALSQHLKDNEIGVFLETAHPDKFSQIMLKAIPNFQQEKVNLENCKKIKIANNYNELKAILTAN